MLLDVQQASAYLNIQEKAVHRLCRQGKLAYVRVDDRGSRRFLQKDLDAYIAAQTVPARISVDKRPRPPVSSHSKGGRETAGQAGKGSLRKEIRDLCQ